MLLIIAAVPAETGLLRHQVENIHTASHAGYELTFGSIHNQQILLAHSGVGQTAMALRLTRLLQQYSCTAVLLCGCGGSYPDSGLQNGDLALASAEIFGDLGVATAESFIPLSDLDIPQDRRLMPNLQQTFDLDNQLLRHARQQLPNAACGRFVTINCCSGYPQLSADLQQRSGGICENMEGAAAAQVCAEFSVPLLELRGISNPTGSRDPQQWDIKAGVMAAQRGLLQLLKHWPSPQDKTMRTLTLGYSPCPNDTFIFYGLTHGQVALPEIEFSEQLEDVETLNRLAIAGKLDLTKISYHALGHLRQNYSLLRSGGALGRGCGPLLVASQPTDMAQLRGKKIAIPGQLTTANLLLQLYDEGYDNLLILPFHEIMAAVTSGQADAGVIIHESRFTYQQHGLHQVLDLGQWWEEDTGCPIPLGGILAKRSLGTRLIRQIDSALRHSVEYAFANPQQPQDYIKQHAQELEADVIRSHINLYVNDFSIDLGDEGVRAVETLFARAEARGIIPTCDLPLFAD